MPSITLIATVHKENGNCSSNELYKIVDKFNPDLIFEELSDKYFSLKYSGELKDNLETCAIKQYLLKNSVSHVPVDIDNIDGKELIDKQFKDLLVKMFDSFKQSLDYCNLCSQRDSLSNKYGFTYLNSDDCGTLFEKIGMLEMMLLKIRNDKFLQNVYHDWLAVNDIRENAMIKNIYDYSTINGFDKAIFLIGANHRKAIINKVSAIEMSVNRTLSWDFTYFK